MNFTIKKQGKMWDDYLTTIFNIYMYIYMVLEYNNNVINEILLIIIFFNL